MKNSTKIRYSIAIVLLQAQTLFAQTPGFDDDVQDVPVDNWILPMAIIGVCSMFYFIKKQTKIVSN
jgi:hypothetical protein